MNICCCLCFGEEEEEYKNRETMGEREGILGDLDCDQVESEESRNVEELGYGNPLDEYDGIELRLLLGDDTSNCTTDVDLNLSLGGEPSSSSAVRVLERCALDRDPHLKRPKVQSVALDRDSFFLSNPFQESMPFSLFEKEFERMHDNSGHHSCLVSKDDGSPFLSCSWRIKEDENVLQEMVEKEIQMDLTDDLLHMVFSFLDHINLCKAAKVCRQWRIASAHEDFWRFLNFENRNISPQQSDSVRTKRRDRSFVKKFLKDHLKDIKMF